MAHTLMTSLSSTRATSTSTISGKKERPGHSDGGQEVEVDGRQEIKVDGGQELDYCDVLTPPRRSWWANAANQLRLLLRIP
jgi:hypothetical protein